MKERNRAQNWSWFRISKTPHQMASVDSPPRTVISIFRDYRGRRSGVVQALTSNADAFFAMCDPEKENLCLYGLPDGSWHVSKPPPLGGLPELPEPTMGINFLRDGMERDEWLATVAELSDAWLMAVAFYYGSRLNHNDRQRLFEQMNGLPTVRESVMQAQAAQDDTGIESNRRPEVGNDPEQAEDYDEQLSKIICGVCEGKYYADEFWITCYTCRKWFHASCVRMTPKKPGTGKPYTCSSCIQAAQRS